MENPKLTVMQAIQASGLNCYDTIEELYRENDNRSKESDMSSTSTSAAVVVRQTGQDEQSAMPSMRDPVGAMEQATKSTPPGKYGRLSAPNGKETTVAKDPDSDSDLLSEPDEDPEVTEAAESQGPKRKRAGEQESIDAATQQRLSKKCRTHTVPETPGSDVRCRLYDVYGDECAVGQSAATNGGGEESQIVQNKASRRPVGAEKQGSLVMEPKTPKTQLAHPSTASHAARASQSTIASQLVSTPQYTISYQVAGEIQPKTAPSSTTPEHFPTHLTPPRQRRAPRDKIPPEVIYISSEDESSSDESEDHAYNHRTPPSRQSTSVPHSGPLDSMQAGTAATEIKVEQQEHKDEQEQVEDQDQELEMEMEQEEQEDGENEQFERYDQADTYDQYERYNYAEGDEHSDEDGLSEECNPSEDSDQTLGDDQGETQHPHDQELDHLPVFDFPRLPHLTPHILTLFHHGAEKACRRLHKTYLTTSPTFTLPELITHLEARKPTPANLKDELVLEGMLWTFAVLRRVCREQRELVERCDEMELGYVMVEFGKMMDAEMEGRKGMSVET